MNKDFLKNFENYVNDMPNDKFLELVNQAENLPWEYKLPEDYSKNEIHENFITKYDKFIIKKIGKTSISLNSFDIKDKLDITTKYSSYSTNKNDYIGVA